MPELIIIVGFMMAAYAIIANDSIQTLGTFLYSNDKRPWWVLCAFTSAILTIVVLGGWYVNGGASGMGGDPSWGRLDKFPSHAVDGLTWVYLIPPLALLILTRFGFPVSTSFLVLITFSPGALDAMMIKSGMGYLVAFLVAMIGYGLVFKKISRHFVETADSAVPPRWYVYQWCSTALLWANWLMQDVANIFVYFPGSRETIPFNWVVLGVIWMIVVQIFIYANKGGSIQQVVRSKSNTHDIRGATLVDLIYAIILYIFKNLSNVPMSTTWVFIGLLAGRELAIALTTRNRSIPEVRGLILKDAGKVFVGLAVSVAIAVALRTDQFFGAE
ncbi:MAG: hypothetical protein ACFE0O_06085 [Opitutales bacterium]